MAPAETSTTLTTNLALAESASATSVRAAAVTAATVTLTLPDGTTYTMTDNGSGDYSCTVKNFPTGSPFVIEAHAGDLVLKNFFDKMPAATDDKVNLGVTDPETTLFTDLLATFVGALDANLNFPTAEVLLAGFQAATLEIDITTLRAQVADDNDLVFQQVRQTYKTVLSAENTASGTSSETLIADAGTLTTVVSEVATGGIVPPLGNDADTAKQVVIDLFQAVVTGNFTSVSAALGNQGFLWDGMTAAEWLADEQTNDEFIGATNIVLNMGSSIVSPGPQANSWLVYLAGELTFSKGGKQFRDAFDDSKDFGETPILIKKDAAGRFAVYGNQKKAETEAGLQYVFIENRKNCYNMQCEVAQGENHYIAFEADVEDTTAFPVTSAELSSTAFSQTFLLSQKQWDDSNSRTFWAQYKNNGQNTTSVGVYNPMTGQWSNQALTWIRGLEGSQLMVDITFADNSTESRTFNVPPVVTPVYPRITGLVNHTDGSVTVNWTDISNSMPGGGQVSWIDIDIVDDTNGWYYIMEFDGITSGTSSATVPAGVLEAGKVYLARVSYGDLYGRTFDVHRYFVAPTPYLAYTDTLLDGKSFLNTWTRDNGERVEETASFTKTGSQYSISITTREYDAQNNPIGIVETGTMTGFIQNDGKLHVDFPETDPDSGATYGISTLTAETTNSITVAYSEFNSANAVVFTKTETQTKL